MAFVKKTWKDRLSEFPKRWKLKLLGTSGDTQSVELELDDGTVITQGDRFNATTMNDLEQRIEDAFNSSASGVSSFNGRVGAVTPGNSDYSSNMISHTNSDSTESDVETEINSLKRNVVEKLPTYASGASSWDTTPTASSTKPVTSGGIKAQFDLIGTQISNLPTLSSKFLIQYYELPMSFSGSRYSQKDVNIAKSGYKCLGIVGAGCQDAANDALTHFNFSSTTNIATFVMARLDRVEYTGTLNVSFNVLYVKE